MPLRVRVYVYAVVLTAFAATLAVFIAQPHVQPTRIGDAMLLCVLAIAAEMLAFALPHRAIGSIGFIPYFAAAILVPSWPSVLSVAAVRTVLELTSDRETIKRVFNIATQTLAEALTVLIFLALGGTSLLEVAGGANLTGITARFGGPAVVAFTICFFFNNIVVSIAIAFATRRSIKTVVLASSRPTWVMDLLTGPLVFFFAWVYAAFGPIAAAALWVPILGLVQVHRINLELERTNEELLELMVKSLEARDPYTSGHSRRVHQYAITIARAMGLNEREIAKVGHAALLHDVGKIYEKYAPVLAKQDHLTPEEWAIIRDHPSDGANLVATMSRLKDMVPPIRHHHENWDGTGYPDGLAGELIPLAARIIRFADTIDAMTTERPYRKPLNEFQVRAEVVRCRGTQFDPQIADALLSSPLWTTLFAPSIASSESKAPIPLIRALPSRGERRSAMSGRSAAGT